jgi:hypothetical protein
VVENSKRKENSSNEFDSGTDENNVFFLDFAVRGILSADIREYRRG